MSVVGVKGNPKSRPLVPKLLLPDIGLGWEETEILNARSSQESALLYIMKVLLSDFKVYKLMEQ